MGNDLIKLDSSLDKYGDKDFELARSSTSFLPRLQLMTSNSAVCKSGEFPANNYALISDKTHVDLGKSVDVIVISWRPKALETGEQIITVYDPAHPEFQRIQGKAGTQDSGCMFGPEFLVWVPQVKKFATFFMGTASSRREAPNVKERLKNAATLSSKKIATKKYVWFAPACTACTTPLAVPEESDLLSAVEAFNNTPAPSYEKVEASADRER